MSINKKCIEKYEKAYEGLRETITPIEFMPDSPYYHMEEWREVLPMFVPGVLPHTFWVSNYGRVYSSLKSTLHPNGGIKAHSINSKGYHQVDLKAVDGSRICVKITRLVMLHFRFVPGCHLMEVDHLDGDKDNNTLWNFQWVLPIENTHRAIINQQRTISCNNNVYYEEGNTTLLSNEECKDIFYKAKMLGWDHETLAEMYNVTPDYVKGLLRGSIRPYICKQFNENIKIKYTILRITSK